MSGVLTTVATDVSGVAQVVDQVSGTTVASKSVLDSTSTIEDVLGAYNSLAVDLAALKAGTATAGVSVGVDVLKTVQSLVTDVQNIKADVAAIKPATSGIRALFAHLF